ncbi:MAG: mechanosensitive ion channel family protein [Deltaproteobacteria bacterium]|nr:mechanosensitive ion channel family protein [Deltaproteobacteria bacterium]
MGLEAQMKEFSELGLTYGPMVLKALVFLLVGLVTAKLVFWLCRRYLPRLGAPPRTAGLVGAVLFVLVVAVALTFCLRLMGMEPHLVVRLMLASAITVLVLAFLLKPLLPNLPFKVGNTVQIEGLFGKVEATNLFHTRLKTFKGRTVFIPNAKILNGTVVNFHFTPNLRVDLDVTVSYQADLDKAEEIMLRIMGEHEHVLPKPPPRFWVLRFGDSGVEVSGRCWVPNVKAFRTRVECFKRIKSEFDQAGIPFGRARRAVLLQSADIDDPRI